MISGRMTSECQGRLLTVSASNYANGYNGMLIQYTTIGNIFGIAKSKVCVCAERVCSAIVDELFEIYVNVLEDNNELTEVIKGYKRFGFQIAGCERRYTYFNY